MEQTPDPFQAIQLLWNYLTAQIGSGLESLDMLKTRLVTAAAGQLSTFLIARLPSLIPGPWMIVQGVYDLIKLFFDRMRTIENLLTTIGDGLVAAKRAGINEVKRKVLEGLRLSVELALPALLTVPPIAAVIGTLTGGIRTAVNTARTSIHQNVYNPIANFVASRLPQGGGGGQGDCRAQLTLAQQQLPLSNYPNQNNGRTARLLSQNFLRPVNWIRSLACQIHDDITNARLNSPDQRTRTNARRHTVAVALVCITSGRDAGQFRLWATDSWSDTYSTTVNFGDGDWKVPIDLPPATWGTGEGHAERRLLQLASGMAQIVVLL